MDPAFEAKTPHDQFIQLVEDAAEVVRHCADLQHCASKLLRFGPDGFNPYLPVHERITNSDALQREMLQLEVMIARVREHLPLPANCLKCGSTLFHGYGLAGGGIGPYVACTNESCDFADKRQDPEGEPTP